MSRARVFLQVAAAAVAILTAVPAGATPVCTYGNCYFYGGDFNPNSPNADGLANEQDLVPSESAIYTPFVATGSIDVQGLFTMNLMSIDALSASWEIRSDVSEGNGGTLIASGTTTPTVTDTGLSAFGFENYEVEVPTGNVLLSSGTYWLNVTPVCLDQADPNCVGRSFNANTDGSGAIGPPEPAGMAFWNSSTFGVNFTNTINSGSQFSLFSSGVEAGTAPVPEPVSLMLFGTGLLGMAGVLRRRRRGV